jgi:Flp pilus assembly protein TadG
MRRASNQKQKPDDKQKGAVAVEFAIVLPVLAILLMGIMEVGSIARDYQVLQNAAREGARFSAMPANRMSGAQDPNVVLQTIRSRVLAYLQNENITLAAGNINVDQTFPVPIGALTVQGSRVTITYMRPLIFPGVASLIPSLGTLPLVGNAVFRNFY